VSETDLPLPDLQDAILDPTTLDRLLTDLALMASEVTVRLKTGAEVLSGEESPTLEAAAAALRNGRVLGIQIRYCYAEASWCDTLLRVGQNVRLVRMQLPADPPSGLDPG